MRDTLILLTYFLLVVYVPDAFVLAILRNLSTPANG